jgi:hypothetical protein
VTTNCPEGRPVSVALPDGKPAVAPGGHCGQCGRPDWLGICTLPPPVQPGR